jgi:hypothetical protein
MAQPVDRFAPCLAAKAMTVDRHGKAGEHHPPHRHLENQSVQPIEQQKAVVVRASQLTATARCGSMQAGSVTADISAIAACSNAKAILRPTPRTPRSALCGKSSAHGLIIDPPVGNVIFRSKPRGAGQTAPADLVH